MTKCDSNQIESVGVDVGKETLSVCLSYPNQNHRVFEIKNNSLEINEFMKNNLDQYKQKIIIESTGRFHLLPAVLFSENQLDVRVINPLISKKYSSSSIRKVKSDKQDAIMLSGIALKEEKLPNTFQFTREQLEIKKKISLIASLEKQLQQLNAIINDFSETKKTLGLPFSKTEKQIIKTVKRLIKQKSSLVEEVKRASEKNNFNQYGKVFSSIAGVSSYVATVASVFFSDQYLNSPKQWIAYAGLDVSVRQSGKWKGKCSLTKRGNPYLRKRLFSAAWGAKMHNKEFRAYYDKLRAEGRNYVEALIIIARKIIRIMFTLAKNGGLFNPGKIVF